VLILGAPAAVRDSRFGRCTLHNRCNNVKVFARRCRTIQTHACLHCVPLSDRCRDYKIWSVGWEATCPQGRVNREVGPFLCRRRCRVGASGF